MLRELVPDSVRTGEVPGVERPRRLRATPATRALVRETRLVARQLVAPLFVVPGNNREEPIPSLAGHSRLSPDLALEKARELAAAGVRGLLPFGIPHPQDWEGRGAAQPDGPG